MANPKITLKTRVEYDIEIYRNDTGVLELEYTNDDGTPIDLTGVEFEMQVKSAIDGSVLDTFSTTSTDITVAANIVTVAGFERLTAQANDPVYDLQRTDGDEVTTDLKGLILIEKDVTT